MPIHVYECSLCGHRFDEFRQLGSDVSGATCPMCLNPADKSWKSGDLFADVQDGGEYHFDEQLGKVVCRTTTKRAMREIEDKSGGRVKLDFHGGGRVKGLGDRSFHRHGYKHPRGPYEIRSSS